MGELSPQVLIHTGWVLGGSIAHAASLRILVSEALPAGCVRRADVELVAGEIAVNAVRHSRAAMAGGFAAELTVTPRRVEVTVHDPGGPDHPRLAQPPDPLAETNLPIEAFEHGRGLALVDAHTDSWGYTDDSNGCVVWASFGLRETPPDGLGPVSGIANGTDDGSCPEGAARQPGSDFPGGIRQPPVNVLTYLLGHN